MGYTDTIPLTTKGFTDIVDITEKVATIVFSSGITATKNKTLSR